MNQFDDRDVSLLARCISFHEPGNRSFLRALQNRFNLGKAQLLPQRTEGAAGKL